MNLQNKDINTISMVDVLDVLLGWWVCFIYFSLPSACILSMFPTSINVCMMHYVTIIHSESKSNLSSLSEHWMRWRQVYQDYHSMNIPFDIRKRYTKNKSLMYLQCWAVSIIIRWAEQTMSHHISLQESAKIGQSLGWGKGHTQLLPRRVFILFETKDPQSFSEPCEVCA